MPTNSEPIFDFLADKLLFKLQVTLAADQAAVDAVVQRIMDSIREKDCAGGKEPAIELALSEALANAVVHGAKSDASKIVECDVACDANRSLLIVVRDPGDGFDPATIRWEPELAFLPTARVSVARDDLLKLNAFFAARALPALVLGPVLARELARFARIWRSLLMASRRPPRL